MTFKITYVISHDKKHNFLFVSDQYFILNITVKQKCIQKEQSIQHKTCLLQRKKNQKNLIEIVNNVPFQNKEKIF